MRLPARSQVHPARGRARPFSTEIAPMASVAGMTAAFFTFCAIKLFHAYNVRSAHRSAFDFSEPNKMLLIATAASLVLTTAIMYIPGVNTAFGLTPLSAGSYFVCLAIGFAIVPIVELTKLIKYLASGRGRREIKA